MSELTPRGVCRGKVRVVAMWSWGQIGTPCKALSQEKGRFQVNEGVKNRLQREETRKNRIRRYMLMWTHECDMNGIMR